MKIRNYGFVQVMNEIRIATGGIHPYFEILYLASGSVTLVLPDRKYDATGPSLWLLGPNIPHEFVQLTPDCTYYYFEVEDDGHSFPPLPCYIPLPREEDPRQEPADLLAALAQTLQSLQLLMAARLPEQQVLVERIAIHDLHKIILLAHEISNPEADSGTAPQPAGRPTAGRKALFYTHSSLKEIVEKLLRYLEAHYTENITLQTLSELVYLNPTYMIRIFKSYCGTTPFQYLQDLRMKAALSYLSSSNLTIQEIVEKTGFQSIHYFSRSFKQRCGVSPTQWRKQHRDQ